MYFCYSKITVMRHNKVISLFLGISMFIFGFLKFFHPFKGWYSIQISASELGDASYVLGIAGELITGIVLIVLVKFNRRISSGKWVAFAILASCIVIIMMATGTYVHLHPDVPADVLPLKVKPPYIPLSFMCVAVINVLIIWKNYIVVSHTSKKYMN